MLSYWWLTIIWSATNTLMASNSESDGSLLRGHGLMARDRDNAMAQKEKCLCPAIRQDDRDFDHLVQAMEGHTGGARPGNVTIATCWDAGRLDIVRVGVRPDPDRLFTQAAREPHMLACAYDRSQQWLDHVYS